MATLTALPDFGFTMTIESDVRETKFEGYSQRIEIGVNPRRRVFDIAYNVQTGSEIDVLLDFFEPKLDVEAITWTPPYYGAAIGKFIASGLRMTRKDPDNYSMSVRLSEVFEV